jgi:hypothetical protein
VELTLRLNGCETLIGQDNGNFGQRAKQLAPLANTDRSRPLSAIKAQRQSNDDLDGTMLICQTNDVSLGISRCPNSRTWANEECITVANCDADPH